jgi:hypothetical protein
MEGPADSQARHNAGTFPFRQTWAGDRILAGIVVSRKATEKAENADFQRTLTKGPTRKYLDGEEDAGSIDPA